MSDRATGLLHEEGQVSPGDPETDSARRMQESETGIHPIVPKIAIGASVWFLLVTWLSFAWGGETDYLLVIVTLFFAFFLVLFLFTASYTVGDPRWDVRETNFREFLVSDVGIGSGKMRGRDVLIEIALIPIALAFAATLIGLAWVIFG
ncbi:MAG: hypothetical protein ACRECX_07165 [Methyloceanibacter sp.]|uniref:hypothetical protein n=1 Tax=Methyloceanibacter sp. TaxID=1965321 RepID=UPI003D6C7CBA